MELMLLGVNHRTADVAAREGLAFDAERAVATLAQRGDALPEAFILSTCNRVEIYAFSPSPEAGAARLRAMLGEAKGAEPSPAARRLDARGEAAARHLLRVSAGLDSMVLGEMQILGQVKDAWDRAREAGSLGLHLDRLLATAVHAGKRARAETAIGEGAVSIASAAVALATRVFGDLEQRRVLVIGAGQIGSLAARHFAERQPRQLLIASRTVLRAEALAREAGGRALGLESLCAALAEVDVAVSATSAPGLVVTAEAVRRAMKGRGNRPLVLVDLAVPRDVDTEVAQLENVFLHSIDALNAFVDRSLARRQAEVPRVEAIVEQECGRLFEWLRARDATPVLRELREHFERVRTAELEKSLRHFPESERQRVERLTRALVNKLLHRPTMRLKDCANTPDRGRNRIEAARDLFALDSQEADHGA
ncbi:MAG: glutamyl-tRNA reductase [Vicinamibacteria bacterium]